MGDTLKTYNAADLIVVFGEVIISGFGDQDAVQVAFDEAAWTKKVGVDGEVTRSKTNNRGGKVTITTMQSSKANDALTALAAEDALSGGGVRPLLVKDGSGRSLHTAQEAWIAKVPDSAYAREAGTRVWEIDTGELISVVGGN